jgi:hypothetical protein
MDRTGAHRRRFYTPAWEPLEYRQRAPLAEIQPRPASLEKLLAAASRLGEQFDFLRVDHYCIGEEIYFGEFAAYPASGTSPYRPRDIDRLLGSYWHLPPRN